MHRHGGPRLEDRRPLLLTVTFAAVISPSFDLHPTAIAEGNAAPNNSHIVQVRIEDANGHCERARKNGAIVLTEPRDQPYGERQYNAQDFYGHRWDFTESIADVAPEEWSGGEFHLE